MINPNDKKEELTIPNKKPASESILGTIPFKESPRESLPKRDDIERESLQERGRTRIPFHEQAKTILEFKQDSNFQYRLSNDEEGGYKIQRLLKAGYEFAPEFHKKNIKRDKRIQDPSDFGISGRIPVGGGIYAYMMRIPKKWYIEDTEAKLEKYRAKKLIENSINKTDPNIYIKNYLVEGDHSEID